jgi:hypothetical protein
VSFVYESACDRPTSAEELALSRTLHAVASLPTELFEDVLTYV